jgi:hypothetical protein
MIWRAIFACEARAKSDIASHQFVMVPYAPDARVLMNLGRGREV